MNPSEGKPIWMVDTTLRDGAQAPGVSFSSKEKCRIAEALSDLGVDEIEAGIPAMGDQACNDIKAMVDMKLNPVLTSWCRAVRSDIEQAANCGTPSVHISFPTSSILLKSFDKTKAWVLKQLVDLISFSQRYFDFVSVGAQDATRTDAGFLNHFCGLAKVVGADRIRLADTVGMINPGMVAKIIQSLLLRTPGLSVEFHGHNDLGMATANAVTAAEAGAAALSVTVNGLGERAGNAPLEEVAVALFQFGCFDGRIKMDKLTDLCRMVATFSETTLHPSKPIVGSNVFKHESGIHCAALIQNSTAYQPFEPALVGADEMQLVIGSNTGSAALCHQLKRLGINVDPDHAKTLVPFVRNQALQKKRSLLDKELITLYENVRSEL